MDFCRKGLAGPFYSPNLLFSILRRKLALKIKYMTHPIHEILGDTITVLLCVVLIIPAGFVLFWMIVGAYRAAFLPGEDSAPVPTEKNALDSLPLGAPRDGGNYIYTGTGWERLSDEDTERVRANLRFSARAKSAKRDPEGWDVLSSQPDPTHPEMLLDILNDVDGDYDGPDDVEEENDEIPAHGDNRS